MDQRSRGTARRIRLETYAVFFVLFAAILFLSHMPLLKLPYFWDEAGHYIPAALDLMRDGAWVPHSVVPEIHPPAVMAYLAAFWRLAGYAPASTRTAMLLLSSFALLASFLLAIELSKEVRGAPAFLAVALLCASPIFFVQSMLAQLDAPAMLFTVLALLLFLQDRIVWSAAVCVVLVLVKETGIVVPLVFAGWLLYERRWRDAVWFAAPALVLGGWIAVLVHRTGSWLGNPEFTRYNLWYPLHPARVGVALVRRIYYVFFANLHWVGTAAIVYGWRKSRLFLSRSWRIAWLLVAAHIVAVSLLGGAVLARYLLPVMPIVYTAMVAGLSLYRRPLQLASGIVLVAGVAAANFINPPYPFPFEDNLAFADFVKLQAETADYIQHWYPAARVDSVWPLTLELSRPDLGFVDRKIAARSIHDLEPKTLAALDWKAEQVLVVYSRTWDPEFSILHFQPILSFWRRVYGYVPNVTAAEARAVVPFPVEAHFERRGQWVDVYVNPEMNRKGLFTAETRRVPRRKQELD
jgi:4-amino-4-deoxy-L-arabinose transferase-like glycosyltransferase